MTEAPAPRSKQHEPPPPPDPLPAPIFDAHCHIDAIAHRLGREPTADFVSDVVAQARAVGVTRMITVGDTVEVSRWCVHAADAHPEVYATVAVHPTEVPGLTDSDYAELERLSRHPKVVAIGETGLDYYWARTSRRYQQEHFRRHIKLAKRVGKPLMIHDRDAHDDVLRILREEGAPDGVVLHAFSGDEAMARTCSRAGYVLSFAGVVTFTNAPALRAAAAVTPADQLLVETDAPFLTPHPYRGRPNAPYLLPLTAVAVSAATGVPLSQLCAEIRQTGQRLFGIDAL